MARRGRSRLSSEQEVIFTKLHALLKTYNKVYARVEQTRQGQDGFIRYYRFYIIDDRDTRRFGTEARLIELTQAIAQVLGKQLTHTKNGIYLRFKHTRTHEILDIVKHKLFDWNYWLGSDPLAYEEI